MREERDEDALDEWFIESLQTYTDLHVYTLEQPTCVLEWTSGRTVCVAGFSESKNHILELSLPLRLLTQQNKGLCAERDFKVVHGGFSDAPVLSLKHIPGTRCVVSSDGQSSLLQLWDLGGDDSDVIRRTGEIKVQSESTDKGADRADRGADRADRGAIRSRGRKLSSCLNLEQKILHGETTNDVQLTDISTGKLLYTIQASSAPEHLSCLHSLSGGAFVCGSVNGTVLEADFRSPAPPTRHPVPSVCSPAPWSMDVGGGLVVRSCVSGQTVVSDLRRMDSSLAQALVSTGARRNRGSLNVSWAPALQRHIALSGVSGLVQIYDTSHWGAELQSARAQFEHRGHMVSSTEDDVITTSHVWHPEKPRTLLSSATDASVHVWDWNQQSQSRE